MAGKLISRHIWLGLGSNQGDRLHHLNSLVRFVRNHPGIQLVSCSRVYETQYVGPGHQDDYLNACVEISSSMDPLTMLEEFQSLERSLGRISDGHMKPRPLDVDFLLVDDWELADPRLVAPHPRMNERLFVLQPLSDLAPRKKIPNSGETVASLCAKIKRKDGSAVMLCPDLVLEPPQPGGNMEE
jgi:2-amino-4-hydroxy-6-hydroxymethyldihydropteridine diphosphokinase